MFSKRNAQGPLLLALAMLFGTTIAIDPALAAGRVKARGATANPEGGVTTGSAAAGRGPNGGAYTRGGATTTDGQGNAQNVRGGAARTPSGGKGARAASTTVNADGSGSRQAGFAASGPRGSAQSSGAFSRSADGTVNGGRSTSATGTNGNSYDGQTTVEDNQVSHSHTCTDAAGEVIPCTQ
jgi:hypothetical protein